MGDRLVNVDGMSFCNYSHVEGVSALKLASRDSIVRIEYDVSIMGEYRCGEFNSNVDIHTMTE